MTGPLLPGLCRCGHTKEAHEHGWDRPWGRSLYCSACDCGRYLRPGELDPFILGTWIGIILVSATGLALLLIGTVSLLRWLFP